MDRLLLRYLDICLLRAGPQNLPASRLLLGLSLAVYLAVGILLSLKDLSLADALTLAAVDVSLLAGLLYLALWARDYPHRYLQALTALAGTGVLIELLGWPVFAWQQQALGGGLIDNGAVISSLLLWIWLLWYLLVIGHILRHALSTILPFGVLAGVIYVFLSIKIGWYFLAPREGL